MIHYTDWFLKSIFFCTNRSSTWFRTSILMSTLSWFGTSYPDLEHPILISNIYPDFEHPFKKIDYPLKKSKDFCYLILNLHTFNLTKIICNGFQNGFQNGLQKGFQKRFQKGLFQGDRMKKINEKFLKKKKKKKN